MPPALDIEYRNVETGDLYPAEWCRNINIIHSTMASNVLICIMETCISMGNESIRQNWPVKIIYPEIWSLHYSIVFAGKVY